MLTLEQFQHVYRGDKRRARHKYLTALFRFGKFGGVASFGTKRTATGDLPSPKKPTPEGGLFDLLLLAAETVPQPNPPVQAASAAATEPREFQALFTRDQVDDSGFVESTRLRTCDVPIELQRYLPSVDLVERVKHQHRKLRDDVRMLIQERDRLLVDKEEEDDLWGEDATIEFDYKQDHVILESMQVFKLYVSAYIGSFFRLSDGERAALPKPDMSVPVYLRDFCSNKSIREMQACVPRVYYYFGACGIPTDDLLLYMHNVPGFDRLYPHRIMASRSDNLLETSARNFFMDDTYDVAMYGVKTLRDSSGDHGLHARFAIKDRVRRKIILFDPHGDFNIVDKYEFDYKILNRVLKSITEGIAVEVISGHLGDVSVAFRGFPELNGFYEVMNVKVWNLFESKDSRRPVLSQSVQVGQKYFYKLPIESLNGFTGVERSTSAYGYEGDQPSEGSCALVSLMRVSHVAKKLNEQRLTNPVEFVRDDIDCHFAVFMSMVAQGFDIKDNFTYEKLDSTYSGISVSVEGIQDHVWVYKVPKNKIKLPVLKLTRVALSRAALVHPISINPYRYRFKVVQSSSEEDEEEDIVYHPMDSGADLRCLDYDEGECRIVIEPLPVDTYNVSIFVKREDKINSASSLQEFILPLEFIRTRFVRDLAAFVDPPFDLTSSTLMMRVGKKYISNDVPIGRSFDPTILGMRPAIWLVPKAHFVTVHYKETPESTEHVSMNVRINQSTQVVHVIREVVSSLRDSHFNFKLKYRSNPTRTFHADTDRVFNLNTNEPFLLVRLHILAPDARVTVKYMDSMDLNEREVTIPITSETTLGDVKEAVDEMLGDIMPRIRLSTSFDSFQNIADDSSKVYPNFDRLTLFYS